MENILYEIGLIILISTLFGLISKSFKQPLILAYIITGIILGPLGLKLIKNAEVISAFSTLGIAFLLFLVGLELDIKKVKNLGKTIIITGLGQVLFTGFLGYLICLLLGFSPISALYIATALTFSSTVIVVKLLSEKKDLNSLYGRIVIGFLLVQDFVAILALILINGLGGETVPFLIGLSITTAFLKGFLLFSAAWLLSIYVLPFLFRYMARSSELLFLAGISFCFLLIFVAHLIGFSIEIGAFLAGVSLASLPYNFEIIARMRSLRDFFIVIFFASLGMQLVFPGSSTALWPIIILSIFVLIGNPLIVLFLMGWLGYRRRTSFFSSVTVAQISEFSLIIAFLGLKVGHISQEVVSLIVTVGIITITISTYLIVYSNLIYHRIERFLKIFEKKGQLFDETDQTFSFSNHAILFGCHRTGERILETLLNLKKETVVVDFSPDVIEFLKSQKIPHLYGDMGDLEILEKAGLSRAFLIISTVPDLENNLLILSKVKQKKQNTVVFASAHTPEEALRLYEAGSDYVIIPHILGGEHVSLLLKHHHDNLKEIIAIKGKHIKKLKEIEEEEKKLHFE